MTTTYTARYAHSDNDTVGELDLNATTDSAAIDEVSAFCAAGHRNGTWANVELIDGRVCYCRNEYGAAVISYA